MASLDRKAALALNRKLDSTVLGMNDDQSKSSKRIRGSEESDTSSEDADASSKEDKLQRISDAVRTIIEVSPMILYVPIITL